MKKKILAVFLSLCMAMSLLPVTALAADEPAASIGEQTYNTLQEAVNVGGEITLLKDVTENIKIAENKTVTLNLNGHKITNVSSGTTADTIYVSLGSTLTINGTGTVDNVSHAKAAIFNNGTVVLNGGSYTRSQENGQSVEASGGNSYYNILNHGNMTINASVSVTQTGHFSSLIDNGYYDYSASNNERSGYVANVNQANPSLTITGGTFSGGINTIKNDDGAKLEIRDGTFGNYTQAVVQNHNIATISGGTFTASSEATGTTYGVDNCGCVAETDIGTLTITGGTFSGATYAVCDRSIQPAQIEISGGSFSSKQDSISKNGTSAATISITAGTFSSNVSAYVADSAKLTDNAGSFTVAPLTENDEESVASVGTTYYKSLQSAIAEAESGSKVKVLDNVTVDTTIYTDKNLIIDLNGKTITGASGEAGRRVFYVQKGVMTLTGEGTVTTAAENDSTFANNSSVIRVGDGSAWEEGGSDTAGLVVGPQVTIAAPASYGIGAFGSATEETVTIYGKVLATGSASAVFGNGLDTLTGTTINIEDGAEISAKNAVAIYHPQVGTMTIGAASITGTGGIEAKAGSTTVTVDGATITATGEVDHTANSDGTSTDGYAIAAVENDDYAGNATIRIENGHFIGPVAVLTDNPVVESKDATIEISGGNFSEPVNKEYLADAISAELYSLRNTATPYSYYPSVEEAQAAAQPGDVVTDLSTVTENAKKFTVVFDYGNGTKKELTMPEGANASLPSLNDRGYNHFQGWNDGTTTYAGGTKVTISKDTTFTAVWTYIPPANPNYRIDIPDFEGGTVTADPAAAKAGATVTLTATPDEGYAVGTITVTDRFGDAVKVTENADGTYTFTMPNGQVTVKATFVETEEPAPAMPFTDVKEGDWFYEEVLYAYENGLMNGVGDNRFAPNSATTRGMLVTILYRLEGEPAVTGEAGFSDVGDTWYTDAVIWAAANDIVNGIGDNQFGPENTLTREQLVTMLYRYAQNKGYDVTASADLSGYPDAGQIQSWAQEAMTWAVAEGIVEGMDGNLNPAGNATRAQIATILMRFCEGVAK